MSSLDETEDLFSLITGVSPTQLGSSDNLQELSQAMGYMTVSEPAGVPQNSASFTLEDMFAISSSHNQPTSPNIATSTDQKSDSPSKSTNLQSTEVFTPPRRIISAPKLQKPQTQRELLTKYHLSYNSEQQKKIFKSNVDTRKNHKEALNIKVSLQKNSQEIHSNLWNFQEISTLVEGMCGCGNRVSSAYPMRVAHFNDLARVELESIFTNLLQWTTQSVFTSLYQQSLAEVQLSRLIHSIIFQLSSQSVPEAFNTLKGILQVVFNGEFFQGALLEHYEYSTQLLRAMVCHFVSFVQNLIKKQKPQSPDLIGISEVSDSNDLEFKLVEFLLPELCKIQGLSWGKQFVHLEVSHLGKMDYLEIGVNALTLHEHCAEREFIGLLQQFPWNHINILQDQPDYLQKQILVPLKRVIQYGALKSYYSLLVLTGNILLKCANEIPELAFDFIHAITAGSWPMKMICSGLLHYGPFSKLSEDHLIQIFGDLYNLQNTSTLEYAKLPEPARLTHREQFLKYLLKYPVPNELQPDSNQEIQLQPVLFLFYQFGGLAKKASAFQRLVIHELYFFGFAAVIQSYAQSAVQLELLHLFQREARLYLEHLLSTFPDLMSSFIYCTGHNLHLINTDLLVEWMKPEIFSDYQTDMYLANWLGYLIAHRSFPSFGTQSLSNNLSGITTVLNNYLLSESEELFSKNISDIACKIGSRLFQVLNWKQASPAIRLYCSIILVAGSKKFMFPHWGIDTLLSEIGVHLLSLPYEDLFLQAILEISVNSVSDWIRDELLLLQILLSLGVLESQYQNRNSFDQEPQDDSDRSSEGHAWLVNWGFYWRVEWLLRDAYAFSKLAHLLAWFEPLIHESEKSAPLLGNLLHEIFKSRPSPETLSLVQQAMMTMFLSSDARLIDEKNLENSEEIKLKITQKLHQNQELRMKFWCLILFPGHFSAGWQYVLFNDLICFCYTKSYRLDLFVGLLRDQGKFHDQIKQLFANGYPWICLMILFSHQPVYPVHHDKNSQFSLLQEFGVQLGHSPAAVAYWLHYFQLYFNFPGQPETLVSLSDKDRLQQHWISLGKTLESYNKDLHRLYYGFSSWNKEILDSATGDFHPEQNIQILAGIYSLLAPYFHISPPWKFHSKQTHSPKRFQMATDEKTLELLSALIPLPIVPDSEIERLPLELSRLDNLESVLENTISYLSDLENSPQQTDFQIPAIEQMNVLVQDYLRLVSSLEKGDQEFLVLSEQTYHNTKTTVHVQVPCTSGHCLQPAIIPTNTVRIEPVNEMILPKIGQNRQKYADDYQALFTLARSLATTIGIFNLALEYVSQHENQLSQQIGSELFFSIFRQTIRSGRLLDLRLVLSDLIEIMKTLGWKFIKNQADYQKRVLELFVEMLCMYPYRESQPVQGEHQWKELLEIFTPMSLFNTQHQKSQEIYLELVHWFFLQNLQQNLQTNVPGEFLQLAEAFELSEYFRIASKPRNDQELEKLLETLTFICSNPLLTHLASEIVKYLVHHGYQRLILRIFFSEHFQENSQHDTSAGLLASMNFDSLELSELLSLIREINSQYLPLQNIHHIDPCVKILRKLTTHAPNFVAKFMEENQLAYLPESGSPVPSALWEILYETFSKLFSSHTEANYWEILLELLYDIVGVCSMTITDKVYYLFRASVFPALQKSGKIVLNFKGVQEIFVRFGQDLQWNASRVLLYDQEAIVRLLTMIELIPEFVCKVFGKLDWMSFMWHLSRAPPDVVSKFSLLYLKLFLHVNTINRTAIPPKIRLRTILLSKQDEIAFGLEDNPIPFVDWSRIDSRLFAALFQGNVLLEPIKGGFVNSDPTQAVLDNCFTLRAIALQMNNPLAALSCIREVSSLMFFCLENHENSMFWHLGYQSHVAILSSIIIPLTHQFSSLSRETREMVLCVIQPLLNQEWPKAIRLEGCNYGNFSSYPGFTHASNDDLEKSNQFYEKLKGLILQFCSAASFELSLHVIQVLPLPTLFEIPTGGEVQFQIPGLSPELWVEVLELILGTFFSSFDGSMLPGNPSSGLECAARSLNISITDRDGLILTSLRLNSALTLLVLLYQWKLEIELQTDPQTLWPLKLFEYALQFVPSAPRPFDILPFWFLILELVNSPRFHPVHCQQISWKLLEALQKMYASGNDPTSILTAKVFELYFYRSIRFKGLMENAKADAALQKLYTSLMQMKSQSKFSPFREFWVDFENSSFLSPVFTLDALKSLVLRGLYPVAVALFDKI